MATDLTACKIHIEQQLPSHIYMDRFYQLSIFLKCRGVPKFLNQENEFELITSIITADLKQKINSPYFVFENPSSFKRSGDTSTKFKITALSNQFQSYRIQCEIPNSPVTKWVSPPFTVVQYKFAMIKELKLIEGDKWYKDEGGKTNFLFFEMGLHENNTKTHDFVVLDRDISFKLQLIYFDDKSIVLNQNILKIDGDQTFILDKDIGKIQIRFKIEQVSSHHQRRRFSLKAIPTNDPTVGPCFSKPILVLSKRNKAKKTPFLMSPQKRKEVATKKKNKNKKRKRKYHYKAQKTSPIPKTFIVDRDDNTHKPVQVPLQKKRKLNHTPSRVEDDYFVRNNNVNNFTDNKLLQVISQNATHSHPAQLNNNNAANSSIQNECALRQYSYPSIVEYHKNPLTYFDHSDVRDMKKQKQNLVRCLRLCCDTFRVLSSRAIYEPLFGFGAPHLNNGQVAYYCCFCHRFAAAPDLIDHYEHCRILAVIELLGGDGCDAVHVLSGHSKPVPIDNGPDVGCGNSLSPKKEKSKDESDGDGNSNNAMVNALLQNIPTSAFPINNSNNIDTNNFAAALNRLLQNAVPSNVLDVLGKNGVCGDRDVVENNHNGERNNVNGNSGFIFGRNSKGTDTYPQLLRFNNKK